MTLRGIDEADIAGGRWWPQPSFAHLLEGPAQLRELDTKGGLAVHFEPLRSHEASLRLDGWQSQVAAVWATQSRTGFNTRPKLNAAMTTLRFITAGQMQRDEADDHHRFDAGTAVLTRFDRLVGESFSQRFTSLSFTMGDDRLAAALRAIDGDVTRVLDDLEPFIDATSQAALALRRSVRMLQAGCIHENPRSDPFVVLIVDLIANQIAAFWPRRSSALRPAARSPSQRSIRRALDFLDAHARSSITVSELAAAAGVSVRSLQHAFKNEFGTTPVAYLLKLRLEGVRRDLLAAEHALTPITTIAERWAFTHMGDFARRYRRQFGERPSQTRGRSGV